MDFILLGNMSRSDGGRETWSYNFLPRLLAADPDLRIRLFAQRTEGHRDTTPDLLAAMGETGRDRFEAVFFPARRGRLPLFFSMMFALRRHTQAKDFIPPRYSTSTGVMEMLMQLFSPKLRRARRVVWLRGIFMDEKAERIPAPLLPLARWLETWLLRSADLLLCNGDDIAAYYRRYGLDLKVIKNSVELGKWAIDPPRLGRPLRVAYIGRPTRVKGIEEFLAAARAIKAAPDAGAFEFHVFGDLPQTPLHVSAAAETGVIIHHGAVDNGALPTLLRDIDACVAFTHVSATKGGGGTSNALMEQMAAGRVIIGWDNVIFRQMLDETNAYMVVQGDVEDVVRAIRAIAADPAEAACRAARARETMAGYSYEAQMARYAAVTAEAAG